MQNISEEVSPIVKRIVDATSDLKVLRDNVELLAGRQQVAVALALAAAQREKAELQARYDELVDAYVGEIVSGRAVTRRAITFRLWKAGVSESAIAGVLQRLILLHRYDSRIPRVAGIRPRPRRTLSQISITPVPGSAA